MDSLTPQEPRQPLCAETKCCTKCGEVKALTEFYRESRDKTKFRSHCKRCVIGPPKPKREKNPIPWGKRPENIERLKAWRRKQYSENKERFRNERKRSYLRNRDAINAKRRKQYSENREFYAAQALESHKRHYATMREWRRKNPDKVRKYNKEFSLRHPGHHIPHRHIRRARKMSAKWDRLKKGYKERIMQWQNHQCPYCKIDLRTIKPHMDHIIALSRGGSHTEPNLQYTCQPCNQRKHAKHPLDFAAEMGIVKDPTLISI